jgi:hypothetical protein
VAAAADDPAKVWTEADLAAKGAEVYGQLRRVSQANGKGVPGAFPALDGSKIVNGPPKDQIHIVPPATRHRDAIVEAAVRCRHCRGDHVYAQQLGQ